MRVEIEYLSRPRDCGEWSVPLNVQRRLVAQPTLRAIQDDFDHWWVLDAHYKVTTHLSWWDKLKSWWATKPTVTPEQKLNRKALVRDLLETATPIDALIEKYREVKL